MPLGVPAWLPSTSEPCAAALSGPPASDLLTCSPLWRPCYYVRTIVENFLQGRNAKGRDAGWRGQRGGRGMISKNAFGIWCTSPSIAKMCGAAALAWVRAPRGSSKLSAMLVVVAASWWDSEAPPASDSASALALMSMWPSRFTGAAESSAPVTVLEAHEKSCGAGSSFHLHLLSDPQALLPVWYESCLRATD